MTRTIQEAALQTIRELYREPTWFYVTREAFVTRIMSEVLAIRGLDRVWQESGYHLQVFLQARGIDWRKPDVKRVAPDRTFSDLIQMFVEDQFGISV